MIVRKKLYAIKSRKDPGGRAVAPPTAGIGYRLQPSSFHDAVIPTFNGRSAIIHDSLGIYSRRAGINDGFFGSYRDPWRINHHTWSNYRGARPINSDASGINRRTSASYRYPSAINAEGFSSVFSEKSKNTDVLSAVSCRKPPDTAEKSAAFFPDLVDTEGLSAVICAQRADAEGKTAVTCRRCMTTEGKSAVSGFLPGIRGDSRCFVLAVVARRGSFVAAELPSLRRWSDSEIAPLVRADGAILLLSSFYSR